MLALGARPVEAVPGALTFRGPQDAGRVAAIVERLRTGTIRRLAFVVPAGTTWSLPLYELALQTAAAVPRAELIVATAEPAPLAAFGVEASVAVAALLADRGVELRTGAGTQEYDGGRLWLGLHGPFEVDAAIALPRLVGPGVIGVPRDPLGFVPVDEFTRVKGIGRVHAVGDMAGHAVKQGGLAAQQADVAAEVIAAAAGAPVTPRRYRPVLNGLMLTGRDVRHLRHDAAGDSSISDELLWWPRGKIASRRLSPYLAGRPELVAAR